MKVVESVPNKKIYFRDRKSEIESMPESSEMTIVNVFDDVEYQEIFGFGGAFTEAAAYNYSLMDSENKKKFIKSYFGRDDGIGYNIGRTHINSCDFSLGIYTYVEKGDKELDTFNIDRDRQYIIPMLKDALEYCDEEIFLFASPWSPPDYMKDNESAVNGGSLKEEYKKVWARYYAKYIKAYQEEGIEISGITVQNEPIANQTWESCYYTAEEERDFLEQYLIPTLEEEGLSHIKIMIWDHNKERVYDRAKTILSSEKVNEKVWAVAHHWYTGDHFDGLRLVHEQLQKPVMCSEFCGYMKNNVISLAEKYAYEMCGNFNNYEIGSCDWNLLLSSEGGPYHNRTAESETRPGVIYESKDGGCYAPILYDKNKNEMILTPIYYYIGHISKFVLRGAKRIATTKYTDKLSVCGFKNPDGSVVVAIYNLSDYKLPAIIRRNSKCTKIEIEAHSAITVIL